MFNLKEENVMLHLYMKEIVFTGSCFKQFDSS